MKFIKLGSGDIAKVDDEDFDHLNQYRWQKTTNGYATAFLKREYTSDGVVRRPSVLMHRLVNKTPAHMMTDHVNGDRLDNRKANLRSCSNGENLSAAKGQRNKSSTYKGVHWLTGPQRWSAMLQVGGKSIYIGRFKTEIEAAKAYGIAARKHHGEFARVEA